MTHLTLFLTTFFAQFIAEMGDKTQLLLISLAAKYRLRNVIFGTALAIAALNAVAIFLGSAVGFLIPVSLIKLFAAVAFFIFAFTSLRSASADEKKIQLHITLEIFAVFISFVIAEAGDKTQLTALTFGVSYGIKNALVVWAACSCGLFSADVLGMIVARILKGKLSSRILSLLSFVLFSVFGFISLNESLVFFELEQFVRLIIILSVAVIYIILCIFFYCGFFHSKNVK